MTRRIVAFTDKQTGITYKTPEFNGDRAEFIKFHGINSADSCTADWKEIFKEFENVSNKQEFAEASNHAQSFYKSSCGTEMLPIEEYICAGKNIVSQSMGKCIELRL